MKPDEIRESFLRFFEGKGHKRVAGAPLVPPGDPTLLFTSAGMVQFKPYFMGQSKPPHARLTSVQKCFRTSDIDSVGDTAHLTFFEMLGNFSVGDYFKAEAIPWAWEFVTSKEWLGLDPERLWAAVYLDDDEAFDLWRQFLPEERIRRYGEEHNYWFSGEVGPCGPCSEIHYDFGPDFGCGPDCEPSHDDCDRFLEIWNLVFMSYFCDGEKREPLPSTNIDTGAGLERMAEVSLFESEDWPDKCLRPSVYRTELFAPVIKRIEELSAKRYGEEDATDRAMRIVAEHARAVTFLIGDERTPVIPSNEERGYAARRILRRAVYFGRRYLGLEQPFLGELAEAVIDNMMAAYPELEGQRKFVLEIVGPEEQRFEETLSRGLEMLEGALAEQTKGDTLSGGSTFLLHDTYGFPVELVREIAAERGFTVDEAGFEAEMAKQRERSRQAIKATGIPSEEAFGQAGLGSGDAPKHSEFVGYDRLDAETEIVGLRTSTRGSVTEVEAESDVEVILARTPFYPEGGGQVGDRGEIVGPSGRVAVEDTQTVAERLIVHRGRIVEGRIAVGDKVTARVDPAHRADTMRNHTGTHLLHAALRAVLGSHVRQSGSLVAPDHLRFDFTHTEPLTPEQVADVQALVNDKIRQDVPVDVRTTTYDAAMSEGVLAFFGEKYGEEVRVVEVNTVAPTQTGARRGKFSAELCGGTHCHRTGEVGMLIVTGESSIGAGMRRIEALTGRGAEERVRAQAAALDEVAARLGAPRDAVGGKLEALLAELDTQRKKVERLERALAAGGTGTGERETYEIDGVSVSAALVEATSDQALRFMGDALRRELNGPSAAIIGAVIDDRPTFLAVASEEAAKSGLTADALVREVARVAGGSGGGRPDMATGGGKDPGKLSEALKTVPEIARRLLSEPR
jgi:alanyl-tRNA synthetase